MKESQIIKMCTYKTNQSDKTVKPFFLLTYSSAEVLNIIERIYEIFFKFANDPKLFDDMKLIIEINMLHMNVRADLNYFSSIQQFGNESSRNIDHK